MKRIGLLFIALIFFTCKITFADEGMWIPLLLDSTRYERMVELGCKLSMEDIYSINNSSLKDAVVLFDRGCTGVIVSEDGLLFTNHHCGYRSIQNHSTLEHDYLTNGFTAHSKVDELVNPGLKVYFLKNIVDVTSEVLENINEDINETDREYKVSVNINKIIATKRKLTNNGLSIKPFFNDNQYLMFEYEIFTDVRLVLAPPSEIGKFGGDTDNWVWPRHTGDFCIFRVYAGKDNKPAPYSPNNVPYKPQKAASISLKGLSENDFTMVLGYPGQTDEYISSEEVESLLHVIYPNRVKLRETRLDIMDEAMKKDAATWIKYSAKYYGISNGWKKWEGAIKGLTKANAVEVKRQKEKQFQEWLQTNDSLNSQLGNIYNEYNKVYRQYNLLYSVSDYKNESFGAIELINFVSRFYDSFFNKDKGDTTSITTKANNFISYTRNFYKNYDVQIDKKIFAAMLSMYVKDIKTNYFPDELKENILKYNGQFAQWADKLYSSSLFADSTRLIKRLKGISRSNLEKFKLDPAMKLYIGFSYYFATEITPLLQESQIIIDSLNRKYVFALKLKDKEAMYPDANLTFRISFGKIEGYSPKDAVYYKPFTYAQGILEKENPAVFDYKLSDKLRSFYEKKNFGFFADNNGNLPVCFIASNHTSGGNSGSPVFNGNGELIGLNFDRCWEGTMSDILYDPAQCRNIIVDIRYLLYMISNYSDAAYLLEEMKLIKD